jgi:KDO2-lipid IV(A) lauroyltransferase
MKPGGLTLLAWKRVPGLPRGVAAAAFAAAGLGAWALRTKGVAQLEANLARALPGASRREVRAASRRGMVAYLRYYREIFQLGRLSEAEIDARVRVVGEAACRADVAAGLTPVLALGHLGNWDFAGAWASRHIAPVTTVAERLEPEAVFADFCRMRTEQGIAIIPVDRGETFRRLLRAVRAPGRRIVPILGDRDLSRGGVEVEWFGEPARLAPGPAALAVAAGAPLYPVAMTGERLTGERRRRARSRRGYLLDFGPRVAPEPGLDRSAQIASMTRRWAAFLEDAIRRSPEDWHMLQKVFAADLDPGRDAAVRDGAP